MSLPACTRDSAPDTRQSHPQRRRYEASGPAPSTEVGTRPFRIDWERQLLEGAQVRPGASVRRPDGSAGAGRLPGERAGGLAPRPGAGGARAAAGEDGPPISIAASCTWSSRRRRWRCRQNVAARTRRWRRRRPVLPRRRPPRPCGCCRSADDQNRIHDHNTLSGSLNRPARNARHSQRERERTRCKSYASARSCGWPAACLLSTPSIVRSRSMGRGGCPR